MNDLEKAAATLQDRDAGWVYRRDAVLGIERALRKGLETLYAYRDDKDVDVQRTVKKVLQRLRVPAPGPAPRHAPYSLAEAAQACEKPHERVVRAYGEGFCVDVHLDGGRSQRVYLVPHESGHGLETFRVFSYCAECDDEVKDWALRNNDRLLYCAFAIARDDGQERLVLVRHFAVEDAAPRRVKAAVKEIAHYADWLERRLTGKDEY